jgi:hypothetical protein
MQKTAHKNAALRKNKLVRFFLSWVWVQTYYYDISGNKRPLYSQLFCVMARSPKKVGHYEGSLCLRCRQKRLVNWEAPR